MKKSRICVFMIILAMICIRFVASADVVTIVGKSKINIPTFSLNNGKYADLETVSTSLFAGSLFIPESGTIISKYYKVKCSNGSFFVLLKTTDEQSVAQMTLPAVEVDGRIKVPFNEFLSALGQLDLLAYDYTSQGSFIQFKSHTEAKTEVKSESEVYVKHPETEDNSAEKDAKYVKIRPTDKHTREIQAVPEVHSKPKKSYSMPTEPEYHEEEESNANELGLSGKSELHQELPANEPASVFPIPDQPAGKYSIPPELNRTVIEELLPKK